MHIESVVLVIEIRINHRTICPELSEKYVLCIGGRGRLYPEYRCLVESLGREFTDLSWQPERGYGPGYRTLLTCADMVICPVDCVKP